MGMSPSCHCICPGTGSGGSPSPYADTITACTVCGTAARRYRITVTHPTEDTAYSCCCSSYTGAFTLTHFTGCQWDSDERQMCCKRDSGGNTCSVGSYGAGVTQARFSYVIIQAGANITYRVSMQYTNRLREFPPFVVDYDYNVLFQTTTTTLDCLSSRTLNYFSHTRLASTIVTPCAGNLYDGGPCVKGWNGGVSPYIGTTCSVEALL